MERHLELIAKSYDNHFAEYGKEDAPSYDNLPDYIINNPDYNKYKTELESSGTGGEGSGCKKIEDYLMPAKDMNFIDLGCCLNLMSKGYDKWLSIYHGVDISAETIGLLNNFVAENNVSVGSLYLGSIHETPFIDSYFDIGACIGVLEYFEKDFVEKAIIEAHRIIKAGGKFALDIPNIESPTGRVMMLIEEYLGRPCKFNMTSHEFEDLIQKYFDIIETSGAATGKMAIEYYLHCKK